VKLLFLVVGVFGGVMLAGLLSVMGGLIQVAFRNMCVMASRFMVTGRMVFGG
jgi:hypothetical protein